jgi:hypothetical protein
VAASAAVTPAPLKRFLTMHPCQTRSATVSAAAATA